ncbi:hypothetical protein Oweho_0647 [Owenweeksia hongkongensis DSM 17368]|uniref:Outer membrane protein beta-barrel domain-containing protein n=1 Tax=Owenweeksia hongkongensis (strain DSM 17368 / CIP 108786 / JCM 12287 / NRRL B-23963 / UST20020801) TaxID=926562 RepID=G8R0Z0_OWEHD|nr:porin family protein [Owenweeksia hongkongensis]AEV31661.1 hypothetical protein Oweho_0647 [Owenweeksia hongkongensis DSM 17368]
MKKLTTFAIIACTVLLSRNAVAQKINVNAGLNISSITTNLGFSEPKLKPGFHIGASVDYAVSDLFSIDGGLLLSSMGYRINNDFDYGFGPEHVEGNISPYYLTIPILLKANFELGNIQAFAGVGPYAAFGLFGNVDRKYTPANGNSEDLSGDIEWGENGMNRFDFGLQAKVGLEFDKINVALFYGQGLVDVISVEDEYFLNTVFGLTVGYTLFEK